MRGIVGSSSSFRRRTRRAPSGSGAAVVRLDVRRPGQWRGLRVLDDRARARTRAAPAIFERRRDPQRAMIAYFDTATTSTRRSRRGARATAAQLRGRSSRSPSVGWFAPDARTREGNRLQPASSATTRSPRDRARPRSRRSRRARRLGPGRGDGALRRADRRRRGAHVRDGDPAPARGLDPARRHGRAPAASARRSASPPWMWIGRPDGADRRLLDHLRAAADRRERDDRDPDRRPARRRARRSTGSVSSASTRSALSWPRLIGIALLAAGAALSLAR